MTKSALDLSTDALFAQLNNLPAADLDGSDLNRCLNYVAEVWNGGHDQWLENLDGDAEPVVRLLRSFGAETAATLAQAAVHCGDCRHESELLDAFDAAFYAGIDDQTVRALYVHFVPPEPEPTTVPCLRTVRELFETGDGIYDTRSAGWIDDCGQYVSADDAIEWLRQQVWFERVTEVTGEPWRGWGRVIRCEDAAGDVVRYTLSEGTAEVEDLDDLLRVMRGGGGGLGWDELPTFGGDAPADTEGVWSWDAERLLVGAGESDLRIVDREDFNEPSRLRSGGGLVVSPAD